MPDGGVWIDSLLDFDTQTTLAYAAKHMDEARKEALIRIDLAVLEIVEDWTDDSGVLDTRRLTSEGLPLWEAMVRDIRASLYPVDASLLVSADTIDNALMDAGWMQTAYVTARGTTIGTGKWRWRGLE